MCIFPGPTEIQQSHFAWKHLAFFNLYGKLLVVDKFRNELDVTSLQDPFTSRPYKTPFYFTIVFPVKSQEVFSCNSMSNIRHLLDS